MDNVTYEELPQFNNKAMTQAKHITRHSVVRHNGSLYMLENKYNVQGKCLLIPCGKAGLEIKSDTLLEVVFYPAQLAINYLEQEFNNERIKADFDILTNK